MREQHDITKLEFLMMVNDNIIVQRFFNVKDYNPSARNSIDFHEFMDELLESLNYQLKMKSVTYLLENQYDVIHNPGMLNTSFIDGPEYFNIYLKHKQQALFKKLNKTLPENLNPTKVNWWILGGSLAFVIFTLTIGSLKVPFAQEIVFLGSMSIVIFLM